MVMLVIAIFSQVTLTMIGEGGGVVSKVVNRQRFVGKETKSNTTQNICRVEEKPLRVFKREHAHEGKNMPFSQQVYMP